MFRGRDAPPNLDGITLQAVLARALLRNGPVTWALLGILVAIGAVTLLWARDGLPDGADSALIAGALVPSQVATGQWWRLVTGTWMHESWQHLVVNGLALVIVGRHVEACFGPVRMWCIYAAAGLCGALGTTIGGAAMSVGASGAIFGLVGALLAVGIRLWPLLGGRMRRSLVGVPAAVIASIVVVDWLFADATGGDRVDRWAHLTGAFGGVALGYLPTLQLRDDEGQLLFTPARRRGLNSMPDVRWAAAALMAWTVAGLGLGVAHMDEPVTVPVVSPVRVTVQGQDLAVPRTYPRGVWRRGRCDGTLTPTAWALSTDRVPCFSLPLGGVLLLGPRDRLLTLDAEDYEAMRTADRQRRFTRREPGVMVYPIGARMLYIVLAPDALHAAYRDALQLLLPTERASGLELDRS